MDRIQLANRVEQEAKDSFGGTRLVDFLRTGWRSATDSVKKTFCDLGRELGFQVAAAGYRGADQGEWLYDMVWYVLEDGLMVRQALVLESEWKHGVPVGQSVEVDDDFQKLVQARADVRVWISTSPNPQMARQHITNCKTQVAKFSGTVPGDTYLFIIADWTSASTIVERFEAA
ncbi:MAG: hypothetical protein ACREQF_07630 [Candidatus Binataceae bacterium]